MQVFYETISWKVYVKESWSRQKFPREYSIGALCCFLFDGAQVTYLMVHEWANEQATLFPSPCVFVVLLLELMHMFISC